MTIVFEAPAPGGAGVSWIAVCVGRADDDPLSMDVIFARPEEAEVRKAFC